MARVYFEGAKRPTAANAGAHWFDTSAMAWRRFSGKRWLPIADLTASRVKWAEAELAVLREHFEVEGAQACANLLSGREPYGIKQRARKLGLQDPAQIRGAFTELNGEALEEAIRLRDEHGWSFARIGKHFGVCEAAATNAYYIAVCPRRGFTPAQRDRNGRLVPAEIERIRAMLRKGLKGCEIQLRIAVSAACVAEQRRRYQRYLKSNRKVPLPPPGGGERYSGAKIDKAVRKEVERLYLEGKATPEVSAITGVSKTHCLRARARLVKRLHRKGESLAGCDAKGKRLTYRTELRVPEHRRQRLRELLLQRMPVRAAAMEAGIGGCTAYRVRDELKAELAAQGQILPDPIRTGRIAGAKPWLPPQRKWWVLYRQLEAEHGHEEARRLVVAAIETIAELPAAIARAIRDEQRLRPLTFEEKLERVRKGQGLVAAYKPFRADPSYTLGGVATGAL